MSETKNESIQNDDGTFTNTTIERNEVIKANGDTLVANSLLSFATCGDNGLICSIQVLKDDDNIRWGAWLTEPGKGIQIYEQKDDPNSAFNESNIHEEDKILAFWLAAERADLTQLSGTATFSGSSDCTDFSQCIGFADDGIVENLTGTLSLTNYDQISGSGDISGSLNISVTDDPLIDAGIGSVGTNDVSSIWSVDFDGDMAGGSPEFTTSNILSTSNIKDATGTVISNNVIGNIGGIFVKPGDIFAGGYNLGTADANDKHVSGVFTLDKTVQP